MSFEVVFKWLWAIPSSFFPLILFPNASHVEAAETQWGGKAMRDLTMSQAPYFWSKGAFQCTHDLTALGTPRRPQGAQKQALGTPLWHLRSHSLSNAELGQHHLSPGLLANQSSPSRQASQVNRGRETFLEGALPILRSISKTSWVNSLLNLQNS